MNAINVRKFAMKIPILYYMKFWAINTSLALGTGVVLGILSKFFILTIPLVVVILYQFFICSYFWGKRRGAFEFSYVERNVEKKNNKELAAFFLAAKQAYKSADIMLAHNKLQEAIKLYPNNFIAHFKYAVSCEKIGDANEAIVAYKAALDNIQLGSKNLIEFIEKQIIRVETKGPNRRGAIPGLQYVIH